jgi:hypothetical protein
MLPPYRMRISAGGRTDDLAERFADNTDRGVRVVGRRVAAGADGPDRLVGNHAPRGGVGRKVRERGAHLTATLVSVSPASRSSSVSPYAQDRLHLGCEHRSQLLGDDLVGLAHQLAPLRVTDDHVLHMELGQHRGLISPVNAPCDSQ